MTNLEKIISPHSIAVIGASSHPEKVGRQILDNIIDGGFSGKIFPVNPKEEPIRGLKTYAGILDLPGAIDMAIIAIPVELVLLVVNQCVQKKVHSIVIVTAGFAEVNASGRQLQEQIAGICEKNNIVLFGPNCLGLINNAISLNASFSAGIPSKGHVSLISQSGAIISSLISFSNNSPIGFSKIFSLGNKALLNEADLLEYLYHDKDTKCIIAYLESLEIDEKLSEIFVRYAKSKPTICLFGGKSEQGAKAALSHTGSIVNSYLALRTYLTQAGVIMADNIEELLIFGQMFSCYQRINGDKIAIITNAGGPGITTADELLESGLKLSALSLNTVGRLKKYFVPESSANNPVDILGNATDQDYERALSIVENDPGVDGIIVLLTPQAATKIDETARVVACARSRKPIVSSFIGGMLYNPAKKLIECNCRPCFPFPNEAVAALKALTKFSLEKTTLTRLRADGNATFLPDQTKKLLHEFQLPLIYYISVSTASEAVAAAHEIGFPVVLKSGDQEAHKTDISKVYLDLDNDISVRAAFQKVGLPAIVGKMIQGQFEIFLGLKKHPQNGTIIIFGTGGRYAEIYQDFSYRIAPVNQETAKTMIMETKIGQILHGVRSQKPHDIDKLAEIIVNSSRFINHFTNISEIDFNPIMVTEDKYQIVDARIITEKLGDQVT